MDSIQIEICGGRYDIENYEGLLILNYAHPIIHLFVNKVKHFHLNDFTSHLISLASGAIITLISYILKQS